MIILASLLVERSNASSYSRKLDSIGYADCHLQKISSWSHFPDRSWIQTRVQEWMNLYWKSINTHGRRRSALPITSNLVDFISHSSSDVCSMLLSIVWIRLKTSGLYSCRSFSASLFLSTGKEKRTSKTAHRRESFAYSYQNNTTRVLHTHTLRQTSNDQKQERRRRRRQQQQAATQE